jgi:CRISPR-associated protein Cas2
MRTTWLVTYDIREPKRLRQVFRVMLGYGDHLQYSVFRCDLTDTELIELKARLASEIHHREDQVLFVDVGPADGRAMAAFSTLGQPYVATHRRAIVV